MVFRLGKCSNILIHTSIVSIVDTSCICKLGTITHIRSIWISFQPELHGHHIYISLDNWRISYQHISEVSLFSTMHYSECIFSTLSVWNVALIWKHTDDKNLKSIKPWQLYSFRIGRVETNNLTILKTYVSYVKPTFYRLAQGSIKLSWKSSGTKATVTVVWVSKYRQCS